MLAILAALVALLLGFNVSAQDISATKPIVWADATGKVIGPYAGYSIDSSGTLFQLFIDNVGWQWKLDPATATLSVIKVRNLCYSDYGCQGTQYIIEQGSPYQSGWPIPRQMFSVGGSTTLYAAGDDFIPNPQYTALFSYRDSSGYCHICFHTGPCGGEVLPAILLSAFISGPGPAPSLDVVAPLHLDRQYQ
jgi:hypothetical protein